MLTCVCIGVYDEHSAPSGASSLLSMTTCVSPAQVEPFDRALKTLEVDCMINGRRRDHGAERAFLEVTPSPPTARFTSLFTCLK